MVQKQLQPCVSSHVFISLTQRVFYFLEKKSTSISTNTPQSTVFCWRDLLLAQFFYVNSHPAVVGRNLLDRCVVAPSTALKPHLQVTHQHTQTCKQVMGIGTHINRILITLNRHTPGSGLQQCTASQQRYSSPSSVGLKGKSKKKFQLVIIFIIP